MGQQDLEVSRNTGTPKSTPKHSMPDHRDPPKDTHHWEMQLRDDWGYCMGYISYAMLHIYSLSAMRKEKLILKLTRN